MQRGLVIALSAFALTFCAAVQQAKAAATVTGTWVITRTSRNGNTSETVLKLKQEGDKVTGTLTPPSRRRANSNGNQTARPARSIEIEDGTITPDGALTFKTSRTNRQGTKMVTTYKGKLEGDVIKGTIESEGRNGQTRSRDFEAKRKTQSGKSEK